MKTNEKEIKTKRESNGVGVVMFHIYYDYKTFCLCFFVDYKNHRVCNIFVNILAQCIKIN